MLPSADTFPRDPDALAEMVVELRCEIAQLRKLLKTYQGMVFGSRSEKISVVLDEQECFDLGDLATDATPLPANDDAPSKPARKVARRNIGALPHHLPRVETIIEPERSECPCCSGALHRIGEDVSEAIDIIPAVLRVIRTVRPKYACRACESPIVQAPAPARLFDGGMSTTSLIAWIVTARYAWYLPLYRQAQMLNGQGINLDRSTMARWVKRTAWYLRCLYDHQLRYIHSQPRIFCDETRMPVQDPGRGKLRIAQFWSHAVDDRPWNGPAAPAVCYVFARSRSHRAISEQLARFQGMLQVDGYAGYKPFEQNSRVPGPIQLAFCLAHARRKFVDIHKSTQSPVTAQIIVLFSKVYALEAAVRDTSAAHRLQQRQAVSVPVMATLRRLLEDTLMRVSTQSTLATEIRYTLGHWQGLTRFLDDGRIEVDTNTVERTMRPVALGRRNSLFCGNDGGGESWAILGSLLHTAKLNGLDPFTWLEDVLERMVSGAAKITDLDPLLAWNWKPRQAKPFPEIAA
jgi:transposase